MSTSERSGACGCAFLTIVIPVFVILKLTGVIDWSWKWILVPVALMFIAPFLVDLAVAPFGIIINIFEIIFRALFSRSPRK